ncbi:glycosyltransferase family 4 protein [Williamsia sp. 1138]|uniref:glycosyltransferase family 4 protein n=1 Tax=Williamsia sp. 1138 TaxID=1903117 RepID=UPI00143CCE20|nr:glycosyltransferase family 4 protein [Williamsia sp. 1138]
MADLNLVGINYWPEPTGIAPYMTGLAEGLAGRGIDVEVITGYPHYPAWKTDSTFHGWSTCDLIDVKRPAVHRLRHYVPSQPSVPRRLLMELAFAVRVVTHRHGNRDDADTICSSPTLLSAAAVLLRKKVSRQKGSVTVWVQDFYGLGAVETGQVKAGRLVAAIRFVEGWVLRNCDHVVVIHTSFKSHIVHDYKIRPEKISIIKNWTHTSRKDRLEDERDIRHEYGFGETATVVLHAGNMGRKQGLENVVNAARLALAAESNADMVFVFLGDGNRRTALEDAARGMPNVVFIDPVDSTTFQLLLAAADVLLVNEAATVQGMAVPSKLTSYFAAGRPVIAATHCGTGTAQELEAAGAGIRVEPDAPAEILGAVARLSSVEGLAKTCGENGKRYVEANLTEDAAINKFVTLIRGSKQKTSALTQSEGAMK